MDRMITEAHWGYYDFPLANGEVAEKGKIAAIDTANGGIVIAAKAAAGLILIGIFMQSFTGDGTRKIQVKLWREIQLTWWRNDATNPIAITDRGKLAYCKTADTMSILGTGRSVGGLILDVDARKGVLVLPDYKTW